MYILQIRVRHIVLNIQINHFNIHSARHQIPVWIIEKMGGAKVTATRGKLFYKLSIITK